MYRAGCYKTRRGPLPAALRSSLRSSLLCLPLSHPELLNNTAARKTLTASTTDKHSMADDNTNPAVEETKVDETPISHPNAARRNSLEKQLAHRPDRAELVESKLPARPCPALPCPARCCRRCPS